MNVLITGGAGFIGSHLVERCLKEGWRISVLDDLSTGSLDNIKAFQSFRTFSCTIDSIFNSTVVEGLMDEADMVFHLAAAVGVGLVWKQPIRTIQTNVNGTEIILAAAARKHKRVLIASSSEVYGKSAAVPFREDADLVMGSPDCARWGYACAKLLDEFLAQAYKIEWRLPVTVLRFFNTVGPRQTGRYGMVLPTFVREALLGEPLTVFGSGEQRRCFGYVGDVVEAMVRIAKSPHTIGEIINIGNDHEITIFGLAELVKELTGSRSEIVRIPYEEAYGPGFEDVARRIPSLEKLERLIGYRPFTPIETIIKMVAIEMAARLEDREAA
jgi:UDP-glucose 4-epimerase